MRKSKDTFIVEEEKMRLIKKLASGIAAIAILSSSVGSTASAIELTPDNQISANEIESVYNQEVQSNSLTGWPAGPNLYSESGIVMDVDSGAILYAKNIDDPHYPASITKVMTALVALENSEMTDRVLFTQDSVSFLEYGDAHIGMRPGEEISMEDALYGMLLASANEVSYAIAETVGHGHDNFIDMMNKKAKELGCRNSHFMNPNGLHNDDHYTSVRDMALIGSAAFQYEAFRTIAGTRTHTIPPTNLVNEERHFGHSHKMLFSGNRNYYEWCVAGKPGFTDQALTTLVTFATKDDKNLVCVTMRVHGGGFRAYEDTRAMLDYAFEHFSKVPVEAVQIGNENIQEVTEGSYVMLPEGISVENIEFVLADPTELNQRASTVKCIYQGQEVGNLDVTITDEYYRKLHGLEEPEEKKEESKQASEKEKSGEKSGLPLALKILIAIVGIVLVLFIILFIVYQKKMLEKKRRRKRLKARRQQQRE